MNTIQLGYHSEASLEHTGVARGPLLLPYTQQENEQYVIIKGAQSLYFALFWPLTK